MDARELSDVLAEEYEATYKEAYVFSWLSFLSRWRGDGPGGKPDVLKSLDDLKGYIERRFSESWMIVKEKRIRDGIIYTLAINSVKGGDASDDYAAPKHYVHLRIISRLYIPKRKDEPEDMIEILKAKYGKKHDYNKLTRLQRKVLFDEKIKSNKNFGGPVTVGVKDIDFSSGHPVLSLSDTYSYESRAYVKTDDEYADERLDIYKNIIGIEPEKVKENIYVFNLEDGAKIQIEFSIIKTGSS